MKPTIHTDKYDLYLGDCLPIMREMPAGSVDAVITDPPYGVGIEYGGQFQDTPEYIKKILPPLIIDGQRISKVVLFPHGSYETEVWLIQSGFVPKWRVLWYKGAQSTKCAVGFHDWENILIYGVDIYRQIHDYMAVKTRPADNGHPCPKDVLWATWLASKFTKTGDIVLDPFMGSGTTGVACMQLGRRFIGVEIDPKYFEIAEKRIRIAAQQDPLFMV